MNENIKIKKFLFNNNHLYSDRIVEYKIQIHSYSFKILINMNNNNYGSSPAVLQFILPFNILFDNLFLIRTLYGY